ncbi:cell wall metabolism sensor histidine kinase WalK [Actinomadura sp. NEAU-AAG7]|uniref:sensor histidine kinase n=1 Tax=Actinomadura sp. NEAU-AAG7 TaxID=2839640 RepID=UPI001BE4D928|nr:HAMP domain-containing sensor histidine kinase [Actinomadura sp. NEAU-AAG7]MBT2213379.1 HAMP domain-containing histidine kinase [Actinomadura sp. NEAU-AAG7]
MRIVADGLSPSCWSVRTRVTVTATVIVALLLIAGVAVFYQAVRHTVLQDLRARGVLAAADVVTIVRNEDPRGMLAVQDADFPLLQVVDDRGRVLASSEALRGRGALDVPRPPASGRPEVHTVHVPGVSADVYVVSERTSSPYGFRTVHAGAPITELTRNRRFFVAALAAAVLLATAAVAWIVALSVRRALSPVRVMSAELADITDIEGGEGERRVTVPDPVDEVSDLARSVNLTLHRLEDVLLRQRAFVADVSHELRSPLTGLRAQLEVALEHPGDEDWPAVARSALADADRLQGIVTDLLILARLGAGVPAGRERVDLGGLVRDEVARRPRRVPVETDLQEGVVVWVTGDHLVRVLTNLLDNAERHARSRVRVSVASERGDAVLVVADDGAGIPPEDRERVFRRFHRLAEGRRRDRGGTGLGLTISRDIAHAHGGSLVAEGGGITGTGGATNAAHGGARLVLRLPLAS